jgi:hypothetical protein
VNDVDFRICTEHLFDLLLKLNLHMQKEYETDVKKQMYMRHIFQIMQDIQEHYYQHELKNRKVKDADNEEFH